MSRSVAIVGTPCEIMAATKVEHFVDSPIEFKIGLFCMENFSYRYFKEFLKEKDIRMDSIAKYRIEKGFAFIFLENGEKYKFPISEVKTVVRKNCNVCVELTSENSDLSVGSIASQKGWSTLIIRSEKANKVVMDAIKEGYLAAKELTHSQFNLLKKIAARKTKTSYENILGREFLARPVLYQRNIGENELKSQFSTAQFIDLRTSVIDVGACVLCGACEYVCPDDLITIDGTKPAKRGKCPKDCHKCFTVCPRTYIPQEFRNDNKKPLGDYLKILTVKSLKNYDGQDGAVVTTILDYLIANKIVTDAVVVDKDKNNPWKPVAKLTNDVDEIVTSSGTKYSVCPVFKALNDVKEEI